MQLDDFPRLPIPWTRGKSDAGSHYLTSIVGVVPVKPSTVETIPSESKRSSLPVDKIVTADQSAHSLTRRRVRFADREAKQRHQNVIELPQAMNRHYIVRFTYGVSFLTLFLIYLALKPALPHLILLLTALSDLLYAILIVLALLLDNIFVVTLHLTGAVSAGILVCQWSLLYILVRQIFRLACTVHYHYKKRGYDLVTRQYIRKILI